MSLLKKTITLLALPALLWAQDPYPPGTVQMTPEVDLNLQPVALTVPAQFQGEVPDNLTLNLPPGFSVKVFAVTGLRGPRMMAFNADGVLHVANMKAGTADEFVPLGDPTGQIVALPDRDNDGVADTVIVAADSLLWANSLAFYGGDMYVADTHEILKFSDNDGDLVYETRSVFASNIPTAGSPHITRTIVADEANQCFYISIGSSCDVCRESDPERATVIRISADGQERRVFATGLRNAIGLDLHPVTGDLWATNNGHTEVPDSMPPEWIDIVRDGGFYGWPLAYGYQVWIDFTIRGHWRVPPITAVDTLLVQSMQRPAALVDAHTAPMDIYFYPARNFPSAYQNAAFVAYRSGFRGPDPGHKVVALFVDPDGSNATVGDFMTGFWPNPPNQDNIWGKPVGLTSDSQGNLYMTSDWINHLVLRVEYQGATGVREEPGITLPVTATLAQNYPNPFNPETRITYRLSGETNIDLSVFTISGQKVATLFSGRQSAGEHGVTWHAGDFASGIYLVKLWAGASEQVRKMILLR
ncbi:MAG: PQQ-dependent sugar dehydrogenase [Calditrichaeota bacterium]|nr:PQQ-dependent sugar dehydrogenase [Calditrichota bacterium]